MTDHDQPVTWGDLNRDQFWAMITHIFSSLLSVSGSVLGQYRELDQIEVKNMS